MKHLPIKNGVHTVVDDDVYEWAQHHTWYVNKLGYVFYYFYQTVGTTRRRRRETLHRMILKAQPNTIGDHIDGNKLDNRRANLRLVGKLENAWNRSRRSDSTSIYRGVCWDKVAQKWVARITCRGRRMLVGRYHDIDEAARAWNEAAKKYHGEFARLNIIVSPSP